MRALNDRRPQKASRASRDVQSVHCSKGGVAYFSVINGGLWTLFGENRENQKASTYFNSKTK